MLGTIVGLTEKIVTLEVASVLNLKWLEARLLVNLLVYLKQKKVRKTYVWSWGR